MRLIVACISLSPASELCFLERPFIRLNTCNLSERAFRPCLRSRQGGRYPTHKIGRHVSAYEISDEDRIGHGLAFAFASRNAGTSTRRNSKNRQARC